ncbi:WD40 repeat-like protein [Laetiporus sulphureus 93-53]|uniref:WD40 repeat-like protein n=1 Tax=Laetiporus sulphureus 93-53 TaxID=1314785 RepID=A0A165FWI6_9APHY|nr:WD40 repeat-like protein [Laetiporus sulphureus 93-53]KZT09505.1 WD40 repeat-like protein [Laetiporus sulphureus 93-53]
MSANSDEDEDVLDDVDFDNSSDDEIDEDILDALEGDLAAAAAAEEASEDEDSITEDSDNVSDDDYDDDETPPQKQVFPTPTEPLPENVPTPADHTLSGESPPKVLSPSPVTHTFSPAQMRRAKLVADIIWPRSYTVEAICAIPHPAPTHCLAASFCMSHLLTGSDDGYIRDYDVFAAVNGKVFLTAPQRHHCGVMEGLMKAGQIKFWWENPSPVDLTAKGGNAALEDPPLSPVYSLAMQSDALWTLAGSDQGTINLFTVRHEPGRLCHVMRGHRGRPVSALALSYDETGFFSAGWDGEALQWDLNTGQIVRNFMSHGAQLTAIGVRPLISHYDGHHWSSPTPGVDGEPYGNRQTLQNGLVSDRYTADGQSIPPSAELDSKERVFAGQQAQSSTELTTLLQQDDDVKSDTSYDPLFDEPDADGELDTEDTSALPAANAFGNPSYVAQSGGASMALSGQHTQAQRNVRSTAAPKNAPPILDPETYSHFSPDMLMTASIDGQIMLWDTRVYAPGQGVGRLWMSEKTPPWCVSACWSADGAQIYAGRRNGTIDIWDVRQTGRSASGTPKIWKTLRNPPSSGIVSCVVAFPDGRHLACASNDNIRLWNVAEAKDSPPGKKQIKGGVQFKIIPGHHGGLISSMLVDPAARFLVSASSNRGWHGESTRTVFVHEIKHIR